MKKRSAARFLIVAIIAAGCSNGRRSGVVDVNDQEITASGVRTTNQGFAPIGSRGYNFGSNNFFNSSQTTMSIDACIQSCRTQTPRGYEYDTCARACAQQYTSAFPGATFDSQFMPMGNFTYPSGYMSGNAQYYPSANQALWGGGRNPLVYNRASGFWRQPFRSSRFENDADFHWDCVTYQECTSQVDIRVARPLYECLGDLDLMDDLCGEDTYNESEACQESMRVFQYKYLKPTRSSSGRGGSRDVGDVLADAGKGILGGVARGLVGVGVQAGAGLAQSIVGHFHHGFSNLRFPDPGVRRMTALCVRTCIQRTDCMTWVSPNNPCNPNY